jgi:hypothetical protein
MKKYLLFFAGLFAVGVLITAGFSIADSEKPVPGPMSVEAVPTGEINWELKAQNEPEHQNAIVEADEPGRPPVWSDGTHPSEQEMADRIALTEARVVNSYPADAKVAPVKKNGGLPVMLPATDLLSEGFEGGLVPPAGWTATVNNPFTWEIDSYNPYEGTYNTSCYYDETYVGTQDEWIISPVIDLTTGGSTWTLSFYWLGSYYWSVDPYPNCDLEVWISTDGGGSWTGPIWDENGIGAFDNWTWYNTSLPLTAYLGETNVKIAFRYSGYDGAQFSVDAISINDGALPTGRCCSGDPQTPSCEDGMYEADCIAISGTWSVGLNCVDNPCPIAGENDQCIDATDVTGTYPVTVTGNNVGATIDCPGVLDWNAVWYRFDVPYGCQNVTIDFCGTLPELQTVGVVLYPDCADCNNYILRTDYAWTTCGGGDSNPQVWWNMLSGPATYYFPVFMGDAVEQEFTFDINVVECPPAQDGDFCDQPLPLNIVGQEALPVGLTNQYTCGRLDYYDGTCLGYYDGGEDIVIELTVDNPIDVDITLDPKGTTYTGFLIDGSCPPDPTTCLVTSTSSGGAAHTVFGVHLDPGVYYVMVDTWPSPDCIPDFDLTFAPSEGPTAGDDCTDPILVKLPDDMPYADLSQKTCGRGNNYSETCLGSYDGGEDIIYMLDVGATMTVDIILDPKGTTYSGMLLDYGCPADPSSCFAKVSSSSSGPKGFYGLTLDPGIYYIMIDTWPSPNCIPDFDLTIAEAEGCTDNDCWDYCDEIGEVFEQPFSTTGSTPDGPGGCMTSGNIWYCYTAVCTGPTRVSLCGSGYDTKLAVYDGVDPNTAPTLGCNDDFCGLQSEVSFDAVEGNTYLIEVGGYGSSTGSGVITIECTPCPDVPPNDFCEDVTPVALTLGVPVTFTGDNNCATNQCASFPDGHVWEAFTVPQAANVTLDYCGTSPAFGNAWLNLALGCPCSDFTTAGAWNTSDCGDGNVSIVWEGLAAGTYYYPVLLDPANGAQGPYTIHVVAEALTGYCSAGGGCDEYIENVTFGEINNTTACDGYGDYTAQSANVEAGGSYPISITIGNAYSSDAGGVWIDWNQDFIFDASEAVALDVSTGYGPYTGTVTVPGDALPGSTRMRVRLTYSSTPAPCGTTSYGEAEDYSVEVAGETGPVWMFVPDPLYAAELFSIDPGSGHIYISDGYTGEDYSAADIDPGSIALTVVSAGHSMSISGVETMPGYGGMPGQVCHITFPTSEYVAAQADGELLWDWVESFFDVTYTYGGGAGSGGLSASVMIRGHISGDLNMDDVVDISDLTMFVEYLFMGGAAPEVIEVADMNASGQVDVTDLTYFVEYMFASGPAPVHK